MRIQGYEPHEIMGQPYSVIFSEAESAAGVPEAALRTATDARRYAMQGWRARKDGTPFWANVVMTALRDRQSQAPRLWEGDPRCQ
jgi:PAS domain S-box-containing protein